jgi:hypothetical protein
MDGSARSGAVFKMTTTQENEGNGEPRIVGAGPSGKSLQFYLYGNNGWTSGKSEKTKRFMDETTQQKLLQTTERSKTNCALCTTIGIISSLECKNCYSGTFRIIYSVQSGLQGIGSQSTRQFFEKACGEYGIEQSRESGPYGRILRQYGKNRRKQPEHWTYYYRKYV